MAFGFGLVLLLIGIALVVVARQRADGTSLLQIGDRMIVVYPAVCLTFIALGLAFMIGG